MGRSFCLFINFIGNAIGSYHSFLWNSEFYWVILANWLFLREGPQGVSYWLIWVVYRFLKEECFIGPLWLF